jgi:hypothetical protein
MSSYWPSHRSLFRKRSRGGVGTTVALCVMGLMGLAAFVVSSWQA